MNIITHEIIKKFKQIQQKRNTKLKKLDISKAVKINPGVKQ